MITSRGTVQVYGDKTSSSLMTLVWDSHCLSCPRLKGGFPVIMIPIRTATLVMHLDHDIPRLLSSSITFRISGSCTDLSNIAYLKFTDSNKLVQSQLAEQMLCSWIRCEDEKIGGGDIIYPYPHTT